MIWDVLSGIFLGAGGTAEVGAIIAVMLLVFAGLLVYYRHAFLE